MLISESSWRLFNWSNLLCWTVAVLWEYLGWHARFLSLSYSLYILFHATIFIALTRFRARRAGGLQVHRGKWMASSRLEPPVEHERCCPKEQWQLWKVKEAWGDRWLTMERDWVTHLTDLTFTAANSVYSLQFFSIALAQFSNEKFFFSKHLVLWTVSCSQRISMSYSFTVFFTVSRTHFWILWSPSHKHNSRLCGLNCQYIYIYIYKYTYSVTTYIKLH